MTKWTAQTDGAKAHNSEQVDERRARDAERLAAFEASGLSVRAFALKLGMSPQRLSVVLRRARESSS